jgi:uncharacterized protein YecE (DUF72 family)
MFPSVELNFSYYRMPSSEQLKRFVDQTRSHFSFSVKANETLTHKIDPTSWKESAASFLRAIETLRAEDRLDALLFQFPYSFHYEPDRRRYLDALLGEFASLPVAVEFRNHEWFNNRVIAAFHDRKVALVSLDLPELPNLPPLMDVVTAPLAYVRFHGRNDRAWWGSDSASRYNYLYSDAELGAWAERIRGIAARADRTLVYFNNHPGGQSVRNALSFTELLRREGLPV